MNIKDGSKIYFSNANDVIDFLIYRFGDNPRVKTDKNSVVFPFTSIMSVGNGNYLYISTYKSGTFTVPIKDYSYMIFNKNTFDLVGDNASIESDYLF